MVAEDFLATCRKDMIDRKTVDKYVTRDYGYRSGTDNFLDKGFPAWIASSPPPIN